MKIIILDTTFPSIIEAQVVSETLVKERLVACAQIHNPMKSLYLWEDELKEDAEIRVSFKALKSLKTQLVERLNEVHSYDIPQLVFQELEVSSEYGKWMEESKKTSGKDKK